MKRSRLQAAPKAMARGRAQPKMGAPARKATAVMHAWWWGVLLALLGGGLVLLAALLQ